MGEVRVMELPGEGSVFHCLHSETSAGGCRRFAVGEVRVMELLRRAGERPPAGDFEALSFWVGSKPKTPDIPITDQLIKSALEAKKANDFVAPSRH